MSEYIDTVPELLREAKKGGELVCRSGYAPNGHGGQHYATFYEWLGVERVRPVRLGLGRVIEHRRLMPIRHERIYTVTPAQGGG